MVPVAGLRTVAQVEGSIARYRGMEGRLVRRYFSLRRKIRPVESLHRPRDTK